jgi:hypothetical protein
VGVSVAVAVGRGVIVGSVVGVAVWVAVGRDVEVTVVGTAVFVTCTISVGTGVLSTLPQATNTEINESREITFLVMV